MSQRCRQQKAAIKWAGYFWVLWKTMVFQGSSCQRRSSTITMASLGKLKDRVGGERINFADVFCARAAKNSNSNFHSSLHLFNFTIIRIKGLCAWLELAALQNVFSQIKWKLNDARTAFLSKPSLTQRANLIWILSSTHRPLIFFIIMRMLQTLDGCPSTGTLTHTHREALPAMWSHPRPSNIRRMCRCSRFSTEKKYKSKIIKSMKKTRL